MRPPDWKVALQNEGQGPPPVPSTPIPQTTNDLVVYLDTSNSMAGYVAADGQSVFGKALRELRYASGTFGNSDTKVLVRTVASEVGPPLNDMELTTASQNQSVYNGRETNLAGAIAAFRISPSKFFTTSNKRSIDKPTSESGVKPDEEGVPAKFHILVTDGVQSIKQGSASHDCNAGSDQYCVRQKIGELLNDNWSGCILGIRADFHGKVYSEVNGSSIPYDTKPSDPSTFRPFYLYIFSPDPRALELLVNSLKDRLRPLLPKSEPIRELNLSFPYTNGPGDFDIVLTKEARDFIDRSKNPGGPPTRFTVYVDVDTERSGAKPFAIHARPLWSAHALDTGNESELAQLLVWDVVPIHPKAVANSERFAEIKIVGTHVDSPGEIILDATAAFPSGRGKPAWRVYRLEGRLNLNQSSPAWIKAWSTDLDTTREVGNRTFTLETALLGLWNATKAKDQVVAEAYVRIGPK